MCIASIVSAGRIFKWNLASAPGVSLDALLRLPDVPARCENITSEEQGRIRKEVDMSITDEVLKANETYAQL